jgi:uncharacterized membrane protein
MPVEKLVAQWLLALSTIAVGVSHFTHTKALVRIVPPFLPRPRLLVHVSGVFEILGGLGLLIPMTRVPAAWGLIALYVAVYPANIYMLTHNVSLNPDKPIPRGALWARMPMQFGFIAVAWWMTQ